MKCLVITPRDQQQQNTENKEHNDAIELLELRDIVKAKSASDAQRTTATRRANPNAARAAA
jgi:hypothetical protein